MSLFEKVDDLVVGRITFPMVNYAMNRRGILRHFHELSQSEYDPEEQLRELQLARFKKVLQYAADRCPFYAKRFKEVGLTPGDIHSLEDARKIPPLTRREVMDNRDELVATRYKPSIQLAEQGNRGPGAPVYFARFRKHRLVRNTSSGSTGAPVVFYEDGSATARNWAHELRLKHWFGHGPGTREARLVRLSTDYLPNSKSLWARKHLWHQLILPGVNLREPDYALSWQKIQEFRPRILWGFTSAVAGLADYIQRLNGGSLPWRPSLVVTWAAPLYDHERKLLDKVFTCTVTNIYGSREVGHIGGFCPAGSLHINQEDLLVESIRDPQQDPADHPGEIFVTVLHRSPMPFIRYQMGDLGEVAASNCPCGRSLQVLKSFAGRTGEVFFTRDGRMISPNFWMRTFMVGKQSQTIERWQVVYRRDASIRLRIVPRYDFSAETEADLRGHLEKNLSSATPIEFEYVPKIEPHPSGKELLIINENSQG